MDHNIISGVRDYPPKPSYLSLRLPQHIQLSVFILLLVLGCCVMPISSSHMAIAAAEENLDELVARKSRYASAVRSKDYLEDTTSYIWQSESLCYLDQNTGREVWILVHGPEEEAIFSKEYATDAWSYDGSTLGLWIKRTQRGTNNPNVPKDNSDILYRRWLVKSNGACLKAAEGYGHAGISDGGFGWANTENAYYAFGTGNAEGLSNWVLAKMTVNDRNQVQAKQILDTSTADNEKNIVPSTKALLKRAISADDNWLSASARAPLNFGRDVPCYGHMRINLNKGSTPTISDYWGVARRLQEYADHKDGHTSYPAWSAETTYNEGDRCSNGVYNYRSLKNSNTNHATSDTSWWQLLAALPEQNSHGGGNWPLGFKHEHSIILYSGSEHIFFQLKTTGSDVDGGPKTEAWDGNNYGANEVVPISSGRRNQPESFYHPYWGHPSFDRWEKYVLYGDGDPSPGTRVTRISDGVGFDGSLGHVATGISTRAQYDGRHHAWGGWTDHIVFFPYYIKDVQNNYNIMYGRKIDFTSGTLGDAYPLVTTHCTATVSNYNAYPRPSQSPDGTKVAFQAYWLNSSNSYPYVSYVIAYYPHPPYLNQPSPLSTGVRINWNSPKYTTRGWPNETSDPPPEPKEVKYYHVWISEDASTWKELTTTGVSFGTNYYDATQPAGTTRYYAITSEEHSRLESRTLSNVWKVTLDATGDLTENVELSAYPTNPGGVSPFWTQLPPAPSDVSVTKQTTAGHYRLNWTEPSDSKIRYYNIYYSTTATPTADQKYRIASVPVGTSTYLDWLADPNATAYYLVTSVDRQGNEGTSADQEKPFDAPDKPDRPVGLRISN